MALHRGRRQTQVAILAAPVARGAVLSLTTPARPARLPAGALRRLPRRRDLACGAVRLVGSCSWALVVVPTPNPR